MMKFESRMIAALLWAGSFFSELVKIVEGVEAGVVAITKDKLDGITTDVVPSTHGDSREGLLIGAADLAPEQISLACVLGAGRGGTQMLGMDVVLGAIWRSDVYMIEVKLDLLMWFDV